MIKKRSKKDIIIDALINQVKDTEDNYKREIQSVKEDLNIRIELSKRVRDIFRKAGFEIEAKMGIQSCAIKAVKVIHDLREENETLKRAIKEIKELCK